MKILERFALILFSIIMLFLAVLSCLIIFNVVELKTIYDFLENFIKDETARKVIVGISAVEILLAIKALFFPTKEKKRQEIKSGVLLENKDGRLLISKETIENLVNNVVRSFDEAIDIQTKVNLDLDNRITVYVSLLVKEDSIIKELSSKIQTKIKDTIKRSTDLDVNQVNINIKDIDNNKKNNNQTKLKISNVQISQNKTDENSKIEITNTTNEKQETEVKN